MTVQASTSRDAASVVRNDLNYIVTALESELTVLSGKRILVVGGAGFLGHYLVQALVAWNQAHPELASIRVVVFDSEHAGKRFLGTEIRDQSTLASLSGPVILTPALPASRTTMRVLAAQLGVGEERLVDPYASSRVL